MYSFWRFPLVSQCCRWLAHTSKTPLNQSIIAGDMKAVMSQISDGSSATGQTINEADERGWTPLMHATSHGHLEIVDALLQHKCINVNQCCKQGHTAIDLANFYRHSKIYEMLVKAAESFSKPGKQRNFGLLQRDAHHRKSEQWQSNTMSSPSSVFIVLRRGSPLIVESSQQTTEYSFLKLHYPSVKSFLTDDNVVFLGTSVKPMDNAGPVYNNDEKVAYYCVDLSNFAEEELLMKLGPAELLHPFRSLKLAEFDRMLYIQAWALVDWHQRYCYCATCGSRTKLADSGYRRICSNTECRSRKGVHNTCYPRVDPSVISAVVSRKVDRCILAHKRLHPSGMHSCIAGFVEPGETMEEACIREVREEISIELDPTSFRYCGSQSWPGPSVLMTGYIAVTADDAQPIEIDKSELESARWFNRSEVVEMLVHRHPEKLFVPPREAIAHHLIKTWVLETGFK